MSNYKAEGLMLIPVDTKIEAMSEEEALSIFTLKLENLARDLNDLYLSHVESIENIEFPETIVEHIERIQSTYVSLKSLQSHVREEANRYTSLKDLYSKND